VSGGWIAPGATVVLELAARDALAPPDTLAIADDRRYGDTRILVLSARGESP